VKYMTNNTVSTKEIINSLRILEARLERDKKDIARLKKILAMRGELPYPELKE